MESSFLANIQFMGEASTRALCVTEFHFVVVFAIPEMPEDVDALVTVLLVTREAVVEMP